jgi:hypothetical protein
MRQKLCAAFVMAAVFTVTACAEQESDAAETDAGAHAPAAAPAAARQAADSTHGTHGADTVPTTTSH